MNFGNEFWLILCRDSGILKFKILCNVGNAWRGRCPPVVRVNKPKSARRAAKKTF